MTPDTPSFLFDPPDAGCDAGCEAGCDAGFGAGFRPSIMAALSRAERENVSD